MIGPSLLTSLMTLRTLDNAIGSCTEDGDTAASFAALSAKLFSGTFKCLGIHWMVKLV